MSPSCSRYHPLEGAPVHRRHEERHAVHAAEVRRLQQRRERVLRIPEEIPAEADHLVQADVLEEREPGGEVGAGVFQPHPHDGDGEGERHAGPVEAPEQEQRDAPEQRQHQGQADPRRVHGRVGDAQPLDRRQVEGHAAEVRREVPPPPRRRARTSVSHGTRATNASGPRSSGKNAAQSSAPVRIAGRNTTASFRWETEPTTRFLWTFARQTSYDRATRPREPDAPARSSRRCSRVGLTRPRREVKARIAAKALEDLAGASGSRGRAVRSSPHYGQGLRRPCWRVGLTRPRRLPESVTHASLKRTSLTRLALNV